MKILKGTCDAWRMLETFGVKYDLTERGDVIISDNDFQCMLDGSKNKEYVNNLLVETGRMYGHGDF